MSLKQDWCHSELQYSCSRIGVSLLDIPKIRSLGHIRLCESPIFILVSLDCFGNGNYRILNEKEGIDWSKAEFVQTMKDNFRKIIGQRRHVT